MQRFNCECGQPLFFDSVQCERCARGVGFDPELQQMVTLDDDRSSTHRVCANSSQHGVCNWLVAHHSDESLCESCRLTQVIPNLSDPANLQRWARLEAAKRRLLYSIKTLRLDVRSKQQDPQSGLSFEFKLDRRTDPASLDDFVSTGHAGGVITINAREADPVQEVRTREHLNEPYRSLLGHMRHESGHYYWDRLIRDSKHLQAWRELFGDERLDYASAMQTYYDRGPSEDWPSQHISAYASAHPWEDWAETWAHYLHMQDTLETASSLGLLEHSTEPAQDFDQQVNTWMQVAVTLNELNRSMGQDDPYPFVLEPTVIEKMRFIHQQVLTGKTP